jgi:hypothetical protein
MGQHGGIVFRHDRHVFFFVLFGHGSIIPRFLRQRQQSGSFSTIRTVSIESNGVVNSLTERPHPGQLQPKESLSPASEAISSIPAEAMPIFPE